MTKKEIQEQKERQAREKARRAKVQAMNAANYQSKTPAKGELNRGQGTKPVKHGMTPAETQRYQALIYAARTPSKGETNRNRENRLVPIENKYQPLDKSKTVPIKTVQKPSTASTTTRKGESIKTITPEYRKSRLEPIKNKKK